MSDLEKFIGRDYFAKHLGIEVLDASEGRARARMEVSESLLNSAGTLHGGALFALADAAFSAASNSHGTLAMAISATISYFRAVTSGTLVASAEEISLNRRLATYLIRIEDDAGTVVAHFQGTVYRKKDRIADLPGQ